MGQRHLTFRLSSEHSLIFRPDSNLIAAMSAAAPYIAFEGPMGVGKTSIATAIANQLGAWLFLEEFDANEFLPDFYRNQDRWALPMQLWFLVNRVHHARSLRELTDQMIVADYSFAKEAILAKTLLTIDRELDLYTRISSALQDSVRKPDIIILLDAENEVLLDRIHRRGRSYEEWIDHGYLDRIRDAYEDVFAHHDGCKIVRYRTSELRLDSQSDLIGLHKLIFDELSQAVPKVWSQTPL